jgi:hypothetical protein
MGGRANDEGSGGQAGRARLGEQCRVDQAGGAREDTGVRTRGGATGSVGRLDRWVQVMDL